jgi:uroporphyrinogen-III synthase
MNNKKQLLSTAVLNQSLVTKAEENGVVLDSMPFICVNNITDAALQEETEKLCSMAVTAVFTSVNAVKAISKHVYITKPNWEIYCIGNATKNALLDYFHVSAIKGVANDAGALAHVVSQNKVDEVVFFCGDKRMDTLPEILLKCGVRVREIVVYRSTETPQVVSKDYDGILFFSPSGVESFFSVNKIKASTVLFAVGETTAKAIKGLTDNRVITSEIPSKGNMVNLAIEYFINRS